MKAIALVVVCITSYVTSERFGVLQRDGSIRYFDETFDGKTNTSLIVFENMREPNLKTTILHVFSKGYGLLKDVKRGNCFLSPLSIQKPKFITFHLLAAPPRKLFRIDHTDQNYTDVMNLAGPVAAEFCRGYTTRFLVEIPDDEFAKRTGEDIFDRLLTHDMVDFLLSGYVAGPGQNLLKPGENLMTNPDWSGPGCPTILINS